MIKKSIFALLIFALAISCKKEDALSKIDPKSTDVEMNFENDQNTSSEKSSSLTEVSTPNTAETPNQVKGKYPIITFNKKEHDFGTIKEGDKVETTFVFTNTGEADLLISDAKGSCGCTVPEYPKEPIKPGKTGKMKVSFDSNGKPGNQQKSVNITSNSMTGRDVLTIKANVTPKPKSAEPASAITNQ